MKLVQEYKDLRSLDELIACGWVVTHLVVISTHKTQNCISDGPPGRFFSMIQGMI